MSLIEQAAKRLQELQRSGAAMSSKDAATTESEEAAEKTEPRLPTPEALMHELSRRDAAVPAKAPRRTQSPGAPAEPVRRPSRGAGPPRPLVELDLARLKEEGFVTPDAPQSQIAHELRVLKRPIIRNAQGQSATRIANGNLVMVTSSVPGE